MSIRCVQCGEVTDLPYECKYCGGQYCPEHRLPEGHNCDGVEFLSATGKRFETKTGKVINSDEGINSPEPMDIGETVGTPPDIEYEKSPPVKIKSEDQETPQQKSSLPIITTLKKLFRL